ncbi:MAG: GH3 auxin-responsive promoter family protein [Dehalococcoidia bacterium]|nr:GH3 auxin-responsive promoter family protein [Dehalococcoidia bacterium]
MLREDEFFHNLSEDKLWQRYCGFLDLPMLEFIRTQKSLLMEEISLVGSSPLGQKIMGGAKPESVEEFRRLAPLTTYHDYEPYLSNRQEDALAEKPFAWSHTSGRGGNFKWIPYTQRALDVASRRLLAILILAGARRKGEVVIRPGDRLLLALAPRPYISGTALHYLATYCFSFRIIPPLEVSEQLDFQGRVALGFKTALKTGVDEVSSIASVLVKVGEQMSGQARTMKLSRSMLHPAILLRLARAKLRAGSGPILPKHLWQPKALMTGGTDTAIYKEQTAYYWGKEPYEAYGATEAFPMALQAWNKKWMTFVPDIAFLEFIPEEERQKEKQNKGYQPATVLLNEVETGKNYELVVTHFYGMPLLRYRMRDLLTVAALEDPDTGVKLPQFQFKARVDDVIDLAGLTQLDEKTVWRAIAESGVKYEDWTARKEYDHDKTYLHLYLEMKKGQQQDNLDHVIDNKLQELDADYREIGSWLNLQPVKVTVLSSGTFGSYYQEKQKEGADLAHLKPPHMNASDAMIQRLLSFSLQLSK